MSSRTALAAIRRLAALGLPSRIAFPEFVSLLHDLTPFDTASMLWLGADFRPVEVFNNHATPQDVVARYATRWFNADEARYYPRQADMLTDPALQVIRVSDFTSDLAETEIYDEIYRQADHHWIVGLALMDGRKPIGNLGLGRPKRRRDFTDQELAALRLARPYIVQALTREDPPLSWAEPDAEDETGFLVADVQGRVVHASRGAWRLLHGVCGAPANLDLLLDQVHARARPMLLQLGARITDALKGVRAAPARLDTVTAYGRFVVRAYALDDQGGEVQAIGVHIEKRLPIAVKMLRSQAFRALTQREQDVAQMLAAGLPYPQIAQRLGAGQSTIVTHVRNLGQKLGASGREDIVRVLCA